ncbi:hypothetical protein [Vibrio sp. WXL103]|uniref:hypothetical protein n=1 Tax=Vibrio sp. WXL103 TaxID=3450710 RepID=UPI003EC936CB
MTLSRQSLSNDPNKFEHLFQLGISYIQELSGKNWTDYNTHDPGITILEQVCFALTDVIYRCDFPVADVLADQHGKIDYPRLGLESHASIIAPPPQSLAEYQNYLIAKLPQLEDLWFQPSTAYPHSGLFDVSGLVQRAYQSAQLTPAQPTNQHSPSKSVKPLAKVEIPRTILTAYHPVRALSEDINQINVIGEFGVELIATIELSSRDDDPNHIAAEIYTKAATWLRERTSDELTLLTESILSLPAILSVNSIQIRVCAQQSEHSNSPSSLSENSVPKHASLMIPESDASIGITFTHNRHQLPLNANEIGIQIEQLRHKPQLLVDDAATETPLPSGHHIQQVGYESVQSLFPRTYQLTTKNLNHSVKTQAKQHQLRSYLLLFDQLMANFCQDVSQLATLYATDDHTRSSYHVYQLSDRDFHNINAHYPSDARRRLVALQGEFDDYPERKGRLLDYLIALYGEQYPDAFHRTFDCYLTPAVIEWQLLANKQQFIRNIATVTNQRGLADNLLDPQHRGGYTRRLTLLLNSKLATDWNQTDTGFTDPELRLCSDQDYRASNIGQKMLFEIQPQRLASMLRPRQPVKLASLSSRQKQQLRQSIYALGSQHLPESLFRFGIDHQRYRILTQPKSNQYRLFFDMGEGEPRRWLYLCRYHHLDKLHRYCWWLQSWLIELNQQCEALYVVEPIQFRQHTTLDDTECNSVIVVMPNFTARHHNPMYRQQAQELIRSNTPAHLGLQVLWLGFDVFFEFQHLYLNWREQKALSLKKHNDESGHLSELAAQQLADFVQHWRNQNKAQWL